MSQFSWLHLSDLHLGLRSSRLLHSEYRDVFEKDLRKLHARSGPWQLVVISGDLTLTGSKREFEILNSQLESLWNVFRSLGSRPVLLAVPGDHDVIPRRILESTGATPSTKDFLQERLKGFTAWFSEWRRAHPVEGLFHEGKIPGDFTATLHSGELKIGVLGLNTVLRNAEASPSRAAISRFTPMEVVESLGKDLQHWALRHDLVLLLTHSPRGLLDAALLTQLREWLGPPGRHFLHLCGSRYQKDWTDAVQLAVQSRSIQVPSLFSERRTVPSQWGYAAPAC